MSEKLQLDKKHELLSVDFKILRRKRCPVCRFDRTYEGTICPPCSKHFEVKPNGRIGRKEVRV
jgi:predicted amidophosphoribosyltransferase